MAALVGTLAGAVFAMSIVGSLFGWILRKLAGMRTTPSLIVGLAAATLVGATLASLNSHKAFLAACIEYAIGGAIALAIMITLRNV